MLGNGFDIHHRLPTTYYCFLKVTEYISNKGLCIIEDRQLGAILQALSEKCEQIKTSFLEYRKEYESVCITGEEMSEITESCRNNPWWNYLINKCNADVGWIDVEKEVHFVIEFFNNLLHNDNYWNSYSKPLHAHPLTPVEKILFSYFDFFYNNKKRSVSYGSFEDANSLISEIFIKPEYIINDSFDQKKARINIEKVISVLFDKLKDLSSVLESYLKIFVERIVDKRLETEKLGNHKDTFNRFDKVITFNYTKTYEKQYKIGITNHLHGDIDGTIVLGVNPDSDDEKGANADLINFKKYYQRLDFDTIKDFRDTIGNMRVEKNRGYGNDLYVFGHSLDLTDGDIIEELFSLSDTITVFYHSEESKKRYFRNLVRIFGSEQLNRLYLDKKLTFKSTNAFSVQEIIK